MRRRQSPAVTHMAIALPARHIVQHALDGAQVFKNPHHGAFDYVEGQAKRAAADGIRRDERSKPFYRVSDTSPISRRAYLPVTSYSTPSTALRFLRIRITARSITS